MGRALQTASASDEPQPPLPDLRLQGLGGLSLQQFWNLKVNFFPIVFYAPLFHASIKSNHHLQISLSFRDLVITHCRNI